MGTTTIQTTVETVVERVEEVEVLRHRRQLRLRLASWLAPHVLES